MIRIRDDSGEDYLYERALFRAVGLVCVDACTSPARLEPDVVALTEGALYEEHPAEPGDPPEYLRLRDDAGELEFYARGRFRSASLG